jgi:hypothetical protein
MPTIHIHLLDGRTLTVTGFSTVDEAVAFSNSIDPDMFGYRTIMLHPEGVVAAE